MKRKTLIIFIVIALLLSGCWDRRELDEIGIVFAVGLDKDPATKEYSITLQIVRPSVLQQRGGGKNEDPVEIFTIKEKTLLQAIRLATRQFDRRPLFSHNKVIVINEELAREGIVPLMDVFRRGNESRELVWYFIAKGTTAKDILSVKMGIESIQGTYMDKIIRQATLENAKSFTVKEYELSKKLLTPGIQPVIGVLEITEDKTHEVEKEKKESPKRGIRITSTAVFKKNKLVGYLNPTEARGLNFVIEQNKKGVITLPSLMQQGKMAAIEINNTQSRILPEIEGNKFRFIIHVKQEGTLEEIESSGVDYKKNAERKFVDYEQRLNKELKERIEYEITRAVRKAKAFKSDIFGLGQAMYRKYPKIWKSVEKNWDDDVFPNVDITLKVEAHIRRTGLQKQPIILKE